METLINGDTPMPATPLCSMAQGRALVPVLGAVDPHTPGGRDSEHCAIHHGSWRGLARHIAGIPLSQVPRHLARTTQTLAGSQQLLSPPRPHLPQLPSILDSVYGVVRWIHPLGRPAGI